MPLDRTTPTLRILVVDDEYHIRSLFKNIGKLDGGYSVTTACDVEEGLKKFMLGTYDLVITDWRMPKKAGLSAEKGAGELLAKKLRGKADDLVIWLMSGDFLSGNPLKKILNNVDLIINKPFDLKLIRNELSKLAAESRVVK